MKFRGFLPFVAISACVVVSATSLFDMVRVDDNNGESTLSLAPMSLGNPAAAATLQTRRLDQPLASDLNLIAPIVETKPLIFTKTVTLKSGNTLSGILTAAGVSRIEAADVVTSFSKVFDPRRIRAGQNFDLHFTKSTDDQPDTFTGLRFEPSMLDIVQVKRDGESFKAWDEQKVLTTETRQATGIIEDSLYMAGVRASLPVAVLVDLIRAYSWDVDFQRSIRVGDKFAVLYEAKIDSEGTTVDYGNILFAELELSGDKLPTYLYTTTDGVEDYFDSNGMSAKKTLMRTPIDGARISSSFGNRKHPVLGYNKMHKGVDFAAARGTPIYAAGDGAIDYIGRKGGYGNYIRIRHNGEYSTAYAHMKGFARSMKSGKRVKQGQIIGYVGTTGRSTGPHLHYEVLKNKTQVNPMKVKMPSGKKLKGSELARFKEKAQETYREYASVAGLPITVAQND